MTQASTTKSISIFDVEQLEQCRKAFDATFFLFTNVGRNDERKTLRRIVMLLKMTSLKHINVNARN